MFNKTRKIGIIGFGNMGSALAERLKQDYAIFTFDKDPGKTKALELITVSPDLPSLLEKAEIIILAVKPQDFALLLAEIRGYIKDKLIISIAAGISTAYLENALGAARVIRAMPNLPAQIGEGITCLSKGKFASLQDFDFTQNLFGYIGEVLEIEERLMNAATAVSGSGPGYLYDLIEGKDIPAAKKYTEEVFIPSLAAAARNQGFGPEEARILAEVTGRGSIFFLEKTNASPSELKRKITSKGGTTEAGLEALQRTKSLGEAVKAALKRAAELSKKE